MRSGLLVVIVVVAFAVILDDGAQTTTDPLPASAREALVYRLLLLALWRVSVLLLVTRFYVLFLLSLASRLGSESFCRFARGRFPFRHVQAVQSHRGPCVRDLLMTCQLKKRSGGTGGLPNYARLPGS